MAGPYRIAKPSSIASFALEGGLILALLYGLAYLTVLVSPGLQQPASPHASMLFVGALFTLLLSFTRAENLGDAAGLRKQFAIFSAVSLIAGIVCFAVLWLVHGLGLSSWLVIEGAIAVPAVVALWRWLAVRTQILDADRDRILIVGTGETARQVCTWISTNHRQGHTVLGFVDEDDRNLGMLLAMGARIQTDFGGLPRFASRVDRVIVALDEKRGKLPLRQLMELRLLGVEVEDATSFFERVSGRIAVETMLPSWLIFSEGFKTSPARRFVKRSVDLFHAGLLLVLASPLMLLTALAIKLDSRGPVLYRQKRLGLNGVEFEVLKFRSMSQDAERESGPTWAKTDDPRVTRIGRLIRKLRVDELPQLVNVLRGEMSFVGPRPERAHFVHRLEETIPYYGLRMTARPGITGWAQVEYRYGASEEDALEKLKYDLYYIKNSNVLFDLWIILKTIKVCLLGNGAR